ncbi:hypothetical protein L9F63_016594, partial [Diploptera punctata]
NLTIRSMDFNVKLTIFAEESRRYLCFNKKWKLVGSKKFRGPMCEFFEDMVNNAYNRYRSAANETYFVGFNRRGRPLRGDLARQKGYHREKCLNFIKMDAGFNIPHHNQKLAGGNHSRAVLAKAPLKVKSRHSQKNVSPRHRQKNHHRNKKLS